MIFFVRKSCWYKYNTEHQTTEELKMAQLLEPTDWTITRSNGNIRYTGDGHLGTNPSYATVIEFHRWLSDLADDASSGVSDDQHDITDDTSSERSTDNIITLLGSYNIDEPSSQHLYDGSIIQGTGGTQDFYDGFVNFGNIGIRIQIIQNGHNVVKIMR